MKQLLTGALAASTLAIAAFSQASPAAALTLGSQLTGDPRTQNPDNLIVDVTIKSGADAGLATNEARWTVDINSPLHPDAKLGQFAFNLAGAASNYSFSGFDPTGWSIQSPSGNVQGSGSANFLFGANDPPRNPNDVTNARNLTFLMTKLSGEITAADFLTAPFATSNDSLLGSFQLGAHLQSLTASRGMSDSGFARGNYTAPTSTPIPTPALVPAAVGAGLAILRKKKQEENAAQDA